jgi:hypothetical protein
VRIFVNVTMYPQNNNFKKRGKNPTAPKLVLNRKLRKVFLRRNLKWKIHTEGQKRKRSSLIKAIWSVHIERWCVRTLACSFDLHCLPPATTEYRGNR